MWRTLAGRCVEGLDRASDQDRAILAEVQALLARARDADMALKAGPEAVRGVPSAAYPTPAPRPCNSRLDTRRLQRVFGLRLPDWQTGVDRLLAELLPPR